MPYSIPRELAQGTVRPWHLLFLYSVTFAAAIIAGHYLLRRFDNDFGSEAKWIFLHGACGLLLLILALLLREFRTLLPTLFRAPTAKLKVSDLAITLGAMLTWAFGMFPLVFILPLTTLVPGGYELFGMAESVPPRLALQLFLATIVVGVLAPIGEEFFFRGLLMNLWCARRGLWFGVILSSIVFGLFHFKWTLFAAAMGFAFALMYLKYGSLWPGILVHSLYNLGITTTGLAVYPLLKSKASVANFSTWIPELILAALFVPFAISFWRRFKPQA